jgi:NUMOD1 domain
VFYIYWHLDPRTNLPVYVGKGKNRRAWHLYNRNGPHTTWIKELAYLNMKPTILIGNSFESEKEAYEVEKIEIELLKKFNCSLLNLAMGGSGGTANVCRKPIICLNTNKRYDSTVSASEDLGFSPKRINSVLKGTKKSYNGYVFRYANEELNVLPNKIRKEKEFFKKHTTSKPIKCNETGETFISITDAANKIGVSDSFIRRHLSGKVKHVRNLTFTKEIICK